MGRTRGREQEQPPLREEEEGIQITKSSDQMEIGRMTIL